MFSPYRPGEFKERIIIQDEILVDDDMGGHTVELVDIFRGWALVRPRTGNERREDDRVFDYHAYLIVIRNYQNINIQPTARITWRNENFNIRAVNYRGTNNLYIELDCEKGVAL